MGLIDRAEKLGRVVLWFSLAVLMCVGSAGLILQRAAEARAFEFAQASAVEAKREAAEAAAAREVERAEASSVRRLSLGSMGATMFALSVSTAEGRLWFSNVSDRSGIVCVSGVAHHTDTGNKTHSLPTCTEVGAYTSNVKLTVHFAGGELGDVCKGGSGCKIRFEDEPDNPRNPAVASGI